MSSPLKTPLAPIKYMGSKRHLLSTLTPTIRRYWRGGSVVDAFSGTSAVGIAASSFARVISVDTQRYAGVIAKALVTRGPNYTTAIQKAAQIISASNTKAEIPRDYFTRTFSGSYFTKQQTREIDALLSCVPKHRPISKLSTTHSLVLVALFHAMSKSVSAPGHFAQPLQGTRREPSESISARAMSFLESLLESPLPTSASMNNTVICKDVIAWLGGQADLDLVFVDPPYSSAQYSRFYHILETAARGDQPAVSGAGLYRGDRYQSPFCRKSEVRNAFKELIEAVSESGASLVLTYPSQLGHLNGLAWTIEDVRDIARKHYRTVALERVWSDHSRLGGKGTVRRSEGILVAAS